MKSRVWSLLGAGLITMVCSSVTVAQNETFQPVNPEDIVELGSEVGMLAFEETVINLGDVTEKKPLTAEFPFTNTGKGPITITQMRSSCGCTTAQLGTMTFQPGEGDVIRATVTPKRPGVNGASITLTTNASTTPVRLSVSLNYIAPVVMDKTVIDLGEVEAGDTVEHTFHVYSRNTDPVIDSVTCPQGTVSFEVGEVSTEGVDREGFVSRVPITLKVTGAMVPGQQNAGVMISARPTSGATPETLVGRVAWRVNGDIGLAPQLIRLEMTDAGEKSFRGEVRVFSRGEREFKIVRVRVASVQGGEFNAQVVGLEEQEMEGPLPADQQNAPRQSVRASEHTIEIVGKANIAAGLVRGSILVNTDFDPQPIRIPFTGLVRATTQTSRAQ